MSDISAACTELLAEGRRFSPEYGDGLANHLPMALIALDRMGADAATLKRFFARYSTRLRPADDATGAADPRALLGAGIGCTALARHFEGRIEAEGVDSVLRQWLPVLMPGVAASAFHGLIRLAYALDAGDRPEIALALAYWTTRYLALPVSAELAAANPGQIADALAGATHGHVFEPGNIGSRIAEMARHPVVAVAALQPAQLSFADVKKFGLEAYREREEFTLLHIVTACHAFGLIQPYLADSEAAVRHLWQAVLLAYLTTAPAATRSPSGKVSGPSPDPALLRSLCCASSDDHVIKLGYSALCEYRDSADARYLQLAWRKAGPQTGVRPQFF